MCLFVAGSVFFSLSFLLSTVFSDIWRPMLMALLVAGVLAIGEQFVTGLSRYGLIAAMSGERYFRGSGVPWLALLGSAALSASMLYASSMSLARRDF